MPDESTAGDWTKHDPWIRESMRRDDLLAEVEDSVLTALARAIRDWFIRVRNAVLGTASGAGTRDTPPDLDTWPEPDTWWSILRDHLVSVMRTAYRTVMRDLAPHGGRDFTPESFAEHIATAWQDVLTWPAHTYDTARDELDSSRQAGDSVRQQRRALDLVLRINAPSRERRERAAEYRRAGKPVPSDVLRGDDSGDYAWHNQARVDARWLTVETANVATLDGARQQQDTAGEPMFKGWMATTDQRVRPAHWHADKQAVPLDEPFTVGGYPMQYPGDTSAPPALWKNCRCTVLVLNSEEAAESNERRDRELPNRTDVHGNPVAADAAPGGDDPMSIPTQPDSTSMSRSERIANSATEHPPAARFTDPQLTGPTKVRVTDDGWVYGHIGAWGTAHAGRPDVSIDRFRDDSLARFHRHPVVADSGERIKTGPLATGGHAATEEPLPTISAVQSHYDDPRFVVADVTAGTDDHGIWISGSVRPGVTPFQVMLLDRYSISGDWRENELLAACSVSVPGFHLDDDHGVVALSASAAHDGQSTLADPTPRAVWAEGGALVACVAAGIIGTTDDAGCAECGTTTASAGDTSPTVDTTALGWEIYRASQHAAAVDHEVTAAARAALAPSLENVIARAELGSDDLDNLTDDDMRAVRRIARLPHRAGKTSSRTTTVAANWVDQEGGLPSYIDRIVKHLKSSMSESHAIATAVNAAKKMCRSGDTNWPGKQDVNAGSRAEACASVREWEAMKRRANAD